MHRFGWLRITFSICNGHPSYFLKIKFKHVATTQSETVSRIRSFRQQQFNSKIENIQIVQALWCEQLSLLMQLLCGVTTLRDTWNMNRGAARQWNSRQRRKFMIFDAQTPHRLQYFRKFRVFEISVSCTTLAWERITVSFRNGRPSYFEKMKLKHIVPEWLKTCSKVHLFQQRKLGRKVEQLHIV